MHRLKDLIDRLRRLYELVKLGWNDFDWDYAYLLILIEWKLDRMHTHFKELAEDQKRGIGFCSVDIDKKIKVLAEMKELSKRFREDEYDIRMNDDYTKLTRKDYEKAEKMKKDDIARFCLLFKRHILTLWE